MPEARLQRARRTLPAGYQFGDAGYSSAASIRQMTAWVRADLEQRLAQYDDPTPEGEPSPSDAERPPVIEGALPWRAPHQNAAEQLVRRAGWNVIEGEEH